MLLIGIGQEFEEGQAKKEERLETMEQLASYLKGLNYFVLSSNKNDLVEQISWRKDAVAAPLCREDEAAWDRYMKWIQLYTES